MTLKDCLYFSELNHEKVNHRQEKVYNVTTYNGLTFDLIEVGNQLMELVGMDNRRIPFTFGEIK